MFHVQDIAHAKVLRQGRASEDPREGQCPQAQAEFGRVGRTQRVVQVIVTDS